MIRYSIETLWHFSCDECGKWWSVGDFQALQDKADDSHILTCPHCGCKQGYEPLEIQP